MRRDKLREVRAGHAGTWAAHPGLSPAIREVFEGHLGGKPNQIDAAAPVDAITEEDLIQPPRGTRTVEGLRLNTRVGVQYLAAWLGGSGSVPLYNLMEDAATAEISRVQNWRWLRHGAVLDAGGVAPIRGSGPAGRGRRRGRGALQVDMGCPCPNPRPSPQKLPSWTPPRV